MNWALFCGGRQILPGIAAEPGRVYDLECGGGAGSRTRAGCGYQPACSPRHPHHPMLSLSRQRLSSLAHSQICPSGCTMDRGRAGRVSIPFTAISSRGHFHHAPGSPSMLGPIQRNMSRGPVRSHGQAPTVIPNEGSSVHFGTPQREQGCGHARNPNLLDLQSALHRCILCGIRRGRFGVSIKICGGCSTAGGHHPGGGLFLCAQFSVRRLVSRGGMNSQEHYHRDTMAAAEGAGIAPATVG